MCKYLERKGKVIASQFCFQNTGYKDDKATGIIIGEGIKDFLGMVGRQTVVSGSRAKAKGFAFVATTCCLELKISFQLIDLD